MYVEATKRRKEIGADYHLGLVVKELIIRLIYVVDDIILIC